MELQTVRKWLGGLEPAEVGDTPAGAGASEAAARGESVQARGALPDLIESGLLVPRSGDRLSGAHPLLTAYLAAKSLAEQHGGEQLIASPAWSGRTAALACLAIIEPDGAWLGEFLLEDDRDFLQIKLLQAGRMLRSAPEGLAWIAPVMRRLAGVLQDANAPVAIRTRALSAMAISGDPGVAVLLRRLSTSQATTDRRLAALGLGMIRDAKSIPELVRLAGERIPEIYTAALLGLAAIGEKTGLETVARLLISGDEHQSRAAAEALAIHVEEGYPTLEEAAHLEDPGARRAAAFGLGRIRQPWTIEILERLRSEDSQWTVQDAASQLLKEVESHPRLPRSLPSLTHTPWLVAFAAERGMGISPGKPAVDMLQRAIKEGNDDQVEAGLYYLEQRSDATTLPTLVSIYLSERGERRERAYAALRSLAVSGTTLPDPAALASNPHSSLRPGF